MIRTEKSAKRCEGVIKKERTGIWWSGPRRVWRVRKRRSDKRAINFVEGRKRTQSREEKGRERAQLLVRRSYRDRKANKGVCDLPSQDDGFDLRGNKLRRSQKWFLIAYVLAKDRLLPLPHLI